MTNAQWGFDLTNFSDAKTFEAILIEMGLPLIAKRRAAYKGMDSDPLNMRPFVWKRAGLRLVTGNNPLTGKYYRADQRNSETGYASYIGISGDEASVAKLAALIKKHAEYIKDETVGQSRFID